MPQKKKAKVKNTIKKQNHFKVTATNTVDKIKRITGRKIIEVSAAVKVLLSIQIN